MIGSWIIGLLSLFAFIAFQAQGIFTGDSGDLVTAAALGGVPHPPGYPLYTWVGWMISGIPLFTVSWRVTLLSSVPHAITIALVYAFIYRMSKGNILASVFGALSLAANYLFFLYSITPEVFALFDMFVIVVWYLLYRWSEEKRVTYFYAACFIYGLSLSHHHLMLFLVPALLYFVWSHRLLITRVKRPYMNALIGVLWMALGLLPYLYIPFAAHRDSIINWDRAVNIRSFIQLVTREDYGTFVSGGSFGQTIRERIVAIMAYGTFVRIDWTWIGIGLSALGVYSWFRTAKVWGRTWVIAAVSMGPLFFFYASFPIINRFALGTYERFLLPTYVLLAIAAGVGISHALNVFGTLMQKYVSVQKSKHIVWLVGATLLLYPIMTGGMTGWRFWGMPHDRTAENLGRDILATAGPDSIVLVGQDTALFTTQFVRYVLEVRPDVTDIHSSRLALPDYQMVLKKHFPSLQLPEVAPAQFIQQFILTNSMKKTRVYSNTILPLPDGWYWVSRGLLYEAIAHDNLPTAEEMYATFSMVEIQMHSPRKGLLSRYPHLMLSDVLDVYANAHIAIGKTMVRAEKWEEARQEFTKAASLSGDMSNVEALELLAVSQLYFKDCEAALSSIKQVKAQSYYPSSLHLKLEAMTYGECFGDEKRAALLFSEYEKLQRDSEQPLETL